MGQFYGVLNIGPREAARTLTAFNLFVKHLNYRFIYFVNYIHCLGVIPGCALGTCSAGDRPADSCL